MASIQGLPSRSRRRRRQSGGRVGRSQRRCGRHVESEDPPFLTLFVTWLWEFRN